MTPEDLQHQLLLTGIPCRVQRDEVVVETCHFCGNTRWNLELNSSLGVFHCWACDAGGRLDRLLNHWLHVDVHIPVQQPRRSTHPGAATLATSPPGLIPAHDLESAAHYLSRRGITRTVARQYEITVCTERGHRLEGRLVVPVRDFWTNITVGHVGRSYTGRRPKYLSTVSERIIAGYRVRPMTTACVLVEGFFDGIAVHRAGYHAAVLSGVTAPRFDEFVARLPAETPIAVLLDGAAAEEAERLFWRIRALRPLANGAMSHLIQLPVGNDPADFMPNVLKQLLAVTAQQPTHD